MTVPPAVPAIDPRQPTPAAALGFALLFALAWVLMPAWINPGQPGDHFEQFTWAHSMEWGYHKHPPLPTWLLGLVLRILGPTPFATYVSAAVLLLSTGVFTFLAARRLLGPRLAAWTIVLWGLQWSFNWKGQMLNHNSAMMCCIAAVVWLSMEAAHRVPRQALAWWIATGLAGGLALLSKYQSAVPLVGLILAMWGAGLLRARANRIGLALAVMLALAVFAPHVVWMAQNDFVTVRYASATVNQLDEVQRVRKLFSFTVLQLRMMGLVALCVGALLLWQRPPRSEAPAEEAPVTSRRERRAWMLGLLAWPLFVLAVLCLAKGMNLQDHWGFQATQFASLEVAWLLRRESPQSLRRLMVLAVLAHGVMMVAYSRSVWDPRTLAHRQRPDQFYPAKKLADEAMLDWRRSTHCPLRYVAGPTYEAGMVSEYSGSNASVLEGSNPALSPWIDMAEMQKAGAIYVYSTPPDGLPRGALPFLYHRAFMVPGREDSAYDVYWAVMPPTADCPPAS